MSLFTPPADLSRATWLTLVFAAPLGPAAPAAFPADLLERTTRAIGRRTAPDDAIVPLDRGEREQLSARVARLRTMLVEWRNAGWWVLGGSDDGFPKRLRRRLGANAPTLLWGRGEVGLCARGGIVRVRGSAAAETDIPIAGAASIQVEGRSIVIEAGGATATELRLSPPGYDSGAVPALHETAWALADAVVVAGLRRGDPAWAGIVALINGERQPVWLDGMAGDAELLLRAGARTVPPDGLHATILLAPKPSRDARVLLGATVVPETGGFAESQSPFGNGTETGPGKRRPHLRLVSGTPFDGPIPLPDLEGPALFGLFCERLLVLLRNGPLGAGPIAEAMGLLREQTDLWLSRALTENTLRFDPETALYSPA